MDLMMPRLDGFEATKRIKRSRPAVKVLAVTSLSLDNAIRQEVYRSGADAFLGKLDAATTLAPMIRSLHKAA
jgi:CheY-like chemotaxis protein